MSSLAPIGSFEPLLLDWTGSKNLTGWKVCPIIFNFLGPPLYKVFLFSRWIHKINLLNSGHVRSGVAGHLSNYILFYFFFHFCWFSVSVNFCFLFLSLLFLLSCLLPSSHPQSWEHNSFTNFSCLWQLMTQTQPSVLPVWPSWSLVVFNGRHAQGIRNVKLFEPLMRHWGGSCLPSKIHVVDFSANFHLYSLLSSSGVKLGSTPRQSREVRAYSISPKTAQHRLLPTVICCGEGVIVRLVPFSVSDSICVENPVSRCAS